MLHPVRVFDVQCGFPTRSTSHSETDRPNGTYVVLKTCGRRTIVLKNEKKII